MLATLDYHLISTLSACSLLQEQHSHTLDTYSREYRHRIEDYKLQRYLEDILRIAKAIFVYYIKSYKVILNSLSAFSTVIKRSIEPTCSVNQPSVNK